MEIKIEELKNKYPKLGMLAESLVDENFKRHVHYKNTNTLRDAFSWDSTKNGGIYWLEVNRSINLQEKEDALSWDFPKKMLCWNDDESLAKEHIVFHFEKILAFPFKAFSNKNNSYDISFKNAKLILTPKVKVKEISIKEAAEIVAKYKGVGVENIKIV